MKYFILVALFIIITPLFLILTPSTAEAGILKTNKSQELQNNVTDIAVKTGINTQKDLDAILGTIIRILLAVIGTIFILFLFLAGQSWMRASGNEEQISHAKRKVVTLIIGLIIVISAYVASNWLISLFTSSADINLLK